MARKVKRLPNGTAPKADNIIRIFRAATTDQLARGLSWYPDAHDIARTLDPDDPDRAAGVIAALSPRQMWHRNITLAARAYADGFASGMMRTNCDWADRIMAGEDWREVLRGPKIRTFAARISDPTTPTTDVVIDRHAFDIAVGRRTDDKTRAVLARKDVYARFEREYVKAARQLGYTPTQVQAVTWTVWRDDLTTS